MIVRRVTAASGKRIGPPCDRTLKYRGRTREGGSVHSHEKSLTALAKLLPVRFARVHRSFIVDLTRAQALRTATERTFLVLRDATLVPLARSYRAAVRDRLGF